MMTCMMLSTKSVVQNIKMIFGNIDLKADCQPVGIVGIVVAAVKMNIMCLLVGQI